MDAHRNLRPRHLEIAQRLADDHDLARVAEAGGDVVDAVEALWPALLELSAGA